MTWFALVLAVVAVLICLVVLIFVRTLVSENQIELEDLDARVSELEWKGEGDDLK